MTDRRIVYVSSGVEIEQSRNYLTGRGGIEWVAYRGDDEVCAESTLTRLKKSLRHYRGIPVDSWRRKIVSEPEAQTQEAS